MLAFSTAAQILLILQITHLLSADVLSFANLARHTMRLL